MKYLKKRVCLYEAAAYEIWVKSSKMFYMDFIWTILFFLTIKYGENRADSWTDALVETRRAHIHCSQRYSEVEIKF